MKVLPIDNLALEHLCHLNAKRYPFLLESVSHNHNNRYSILFAHPQQQIILNNLGDFDFLQKLSSKVIFDNNEVNLPFTGGWFVYLSYELIAQIEPILLNSIQVGNLPIAIAINIPCAIIKDHSDNQSYLLDQFDNQNRIQQTLDDLNNLQEVAQDKAHNTTTLNLSGQLNCEVESEFLSAVKRIKDYIKAGDVFQVNLSRQWSYQLDKTNSATQIYQALKRANPAPFSALAQFDNFSIISSSPERLFSVNGNQIQTRPIAGTHPRGTGAQDEALKAQLINHPKEQAEHIMLLDLERNDLGRVCEYGSVHVDEVMSLESYAYVHHIVSNIKGKLKQGITIKDIISALFPGGTITGCPKVRCMQIIAELEKMPRQTYTGSLGYISSNGKIDFNILIRSMIQHHKTLSFRAGAGIVFDSIAERELAETQHKAQGILKLFSNSKTT